MIHYNDVRRKGGFILYLKSHVAGVPLHDASVRVNLIIDTTTGPIVIVIVGVVSIVVHCLALIVHILKLLVTHSEVVGVIMHGYRDRVLAFLDENRDVLVVVTRVAVDTGARLAKVIHVAVSVEWSRVVIQRASVPGIPPLSTGE